MPKTLTSEQEQIFQELIRSLVYEETYEDEQGNTVFYITWEEFFDNYSNLLDSEIWTRYCQQKMKEVGVLELSQEEAKIKQEEKKQIYQNNI